MKKILIVTALFLALMQVPAQAGNYSNKSGYQGSANGTPGDLVFRTSLLANGRQAASSVLFSSSTSMGTSNLPYGVIYKSIGNNPTPEVSLLKAGVPGQVATFIILAAGPSGSWRLSPDSGVAALNWTGITFTATGQSATLLYMDDTIGWFVMSSSVVITTTSKAQ